MNLRNAFIEKMYTYVNCTGTFDLVSPTSTCETYGLCDLVTITIANQQRCHLSHCLYCRAAPAEFFCDRVLYRDIYRVLDDTRS